MDRGGDGVGGPPRGCRRQSLDTQADSLRGAGVTRIFAEKISTRTVTESGTIWGRLRCERHGIRGLVEAKHLRSPPPGERLAGWDVG